MNVTRRGFIGGALAFGMGGPTYVSAVDGTEPVPPKPNLRFGVMSDVHIGGKKDAEATAEKVLRWFASESVDAVLCPGDIAHSGLIASGSWRSSRRFGARCSRMAGGVLSS